jgi:hypothetical protein
MIKLDRPVQDAGNVFITCISRVRDAQLKARLAGVTQAVVDASAEFDDAATHTRLHQIAPQDVVGGIVTQAEMEAVYTTRMAKKGAPGREIYDMLLISAPQDRCPLCGHRTVSTLDHHLPKSRYPALAVAPLNLVPACSDCNKSKLESIPANASAEMLHPYFDDIDGDRWLAAEMIHTRPAGLRFFVQAPAHWSDVLRSRVEWHFRTLELGRLYSSEAADELLNIRHQLRTLHRSGGAALVRIELHERAVSCQYARRNGWRTVTYHSFADSDWFCDGGFNA